MTELKVGEVAILRTTEEPCFVLHIYETPSEPDKYKRRGLSAMMAEVRRPMQTNEGIQHCVCTYHVEELESLEDKKKRVMDDYLGFEAAGKAAGAQHKVGSLAEVDGNTFRN